MNVFSRFKSFWLGTLSFVVLLVLWESLVRLGAINPFLTSSPSAIAVNLVRQVQSGELAANLGVSLFEFGVGFGAAVVTGILMGILMGWYRLLEYTLEPFVWFIYSAPLIAFYPLFVIWLGLGKPTVIAITFLFSYAPILVNTASGVKPVDKELIRAAISFGARRSDLFFKVVLPGSVPMVMAGLRLGVGRALLGVVVAELFGATAGLGYSINYYGALMQTTDMFVSLTVILVLGVGFTQGVRMLEHRFDSWRVGHEK